MVYIRARQLPKLHEYKYAGVDHSLVSKYILKPFYTHVVIKCFPLTIAPNAITLSGFGFVVINFLTMLWYNPTLDQDAPPWVYATWAVGLFLYQTFDAIDGTQARRTGQSGPLGELFDHGVDAVNTILEVVLFAAAMNLGQGWMTVLTLFGSAFTFYVQTWDEYYTQTLTLGIVSGPVEGVLTLCIVYAITAVKGGGSYWQRAMLPTVGIDQPSWMPDSFYEMPFNQWYIVYGSIVLVFNTVESIRHVFKVRATAAPHSKEGFNPLAGLAPAITMWTMTVAYLYLQPVILRQHLVPFCFYLGLVNAYSVGKIIIAHLTKNPTFPYTNSLIWPLTIGVADSLGPRFGLWPSVFGDGMYQVSFMFASLGLAVGVYGSFVYDVITTICDYLDIWCLTIKHPKTTSETKKGK